METEIKVLNEVNLAEEIEKDEFVEPISSLDAEYENMEKITICSSVQYK